MNMRVLTIRMSDDDTQALRQQAAREGRSMNDVTVLAVRERIARDIRLQDDATAIRRAIAENGPLLDLLAQ